MIFQVSYFFFIKNWLSVVSIASFDCVMTFKVFFLLLNAVVDLRKTLTYWNVPA